MSNAALAQGFLAMPDATEVPEYERESMLLDLDVPPVRDRDPDPEAGPRLNVKEFRLQGLVEYPELGITRAELIKRVEAIRFDIMKESEITDSGYTLDELGEISDLIADIEKKTNEEHVGPLEVQQLVFLIRDQRRRRGVTLGMIEGVADTITRFYRERGFILAKAYIPEQKVRDGIVTLTLLLGELGEVRVENRKRASVKMIQRTFGKDLHQPVTSWKVEESLNLINDIPGLSAQGFFSPGQQVGDTKLSVNVTDEKLVSGNVRLDNHGSDATSENRAYLDVYLHNPLGFGDELHVAILKTYSPDRSTYGAIRYNSFIGHPRMRASIGFSTNDFVSRQTNDGTTFFTGESEVADISLKYLLKRSRVKNFSTEFKYVDISTALDTDAAITIGDSKNLSLGFNFDVLNEKRRQLYVGNVALVIADTFENRFEGDVETSKTFLTYDFSMLSFYNIPFTDNKTKVLFKVVGQYVGQPLSNINQFSLTGPTRARGFSVNGFQADDAIYVGADWLFTLPKFNGAQLLGVNINRIFQPYLFVDSTYGILHPLNDGEDNEEITGQLANVGFGLKFNHSNFSGSLVASKVVTDKSNFQDETPNKDFYLDLQYTF